MSIVWERNTQCEWFVQVLQVRPKPCVNLRLVSAGAGLFQNIGVLRDWGISAVDPPPPSFFRGPSSPRPLRALTQPVRRSR